MTRSLVIAIAFLASSAHADVWKRAIEGQDQARAIYDEAMREGDEAVLLANPQSSSLKQIKTQVSAAVAGSGTTLTDLHGIGDVTAAKILARSGAVSRFRSESAFASYCGVAPIEVSSGDIQRHRLSRAGDWQLNYALHLMAMAQIKRPTPGRDYYQRK